MDELKTNYERRAWTTKEDETIAELVRLHGLKKWSVVAAELKQRTIGPPRTGKQCRTRWLNHLDPDIKREPWSEQEENTIYRLQKEIGNKWADIAKELPGRTDNAIKNHWYSTMRRNMRRVAKEITQKIKEVGKANVDVTTLESLKDFHMPLEINLQNILGQLTESDTAMFNRCYQMLQNSIRQKEEQDNAAHAAARKAGGGRSGRGGGSIAASAKVVSGGSAAAAVAAGARPSSSHKRKLARPPTLNTAAAATKTASGKARVRLDSAATKAAVASMASPAVLGSAVASPARNKLHQDILFRLLAGGGGGGGAAVGGGGGGGRGTAAATGSGARGAGAGGFVGGLPTPGSPRLSAIFGGASSSSSTTATTTASAAGGGRGAAGAAAAAAAAAGTGGDPDDTAALFALPTPRLGPHLFSPSTSFAPSMLLTPIISPGFLDSARDHQHHQQQFPGGPRSVSGVTPHQGSAAGGGSAPHSGGSGSSGPQKFTFDFDGTLNSHGGGGSVGGAAAAGNARPGNAGGGGAGLAGLKSPTFPMMRMLMSPGGFAWTPTPGAAAAAGGGGGGGGAGAGGGGGGGGGGGTGGTGGFERLDTALVASPSNSTGKPSPAAAGAQSLP